MRCSCLKSNAVLTGALSSLFFVTLNVAMNIYMKWLFAESGGDFALPWTMLAIQQLEAYMCLQPLIYRQDPFGRGGWGFGAGEVRGSNGDEASVRHDGYKPLEVIHLLQVLTVTLLFCLNVGLNSLSLVEISITLNQTVRAFLPVGVLLLSSFIEQRAYPTHSYVTTVILVLGIALTCWGSPDFNWHGFTLAFVSTLVAAVGTSLNGRLLSKGPFSKGGPYGIARLMMIQSVPAFIIFGIIAWFTERDRLVDKFTDGSSRWPWHQTLLLVSASSMLALLSNLGRCFLVAATSALMETFAGNAKVAALCAIDHSLFGTVLYLYNYVGIALTFSGFSVHVLLQYAWKEKDEPAAPEPPQGPDGVCQQPSEVGATTSEVGGRLSSAAKRLVRPRLVSGADTGLLAEHFALDMGRDTKKAGSDCSTSISGDQPRQRAMTWQQSVNPFLQPEYTAALASNFEWGQVWEVPSFEWLDGGRPAGEEWNPLSPSAGSPSRRANGGGSTPGSRSRFLSDQLHDRTPKSRREEHSNSMPNFFPENGSIGFGVLSVVEEEDEGLMSHAGSYRPPWGRARSKGVRECAAEVVAEVQRNLPPVDVGYL